MTRHIERRLSTCITSRSKEGAQTRPQRGDQTGSRAASARFSRSHRIAPTGHAAQPAAAASDASVATCPTQTQVRRKPAYSLFSASPYPRESSRRGTRVSALRGSPEWPSCTARHADVEPLPTHVDGPPSARGLLVVGRESDPGTCRLPACGPPVGLPWRRIPTRRPTTLRSRRSPDCGGRGLRRHRHEPALCAQGMPLGALRPGRHARQRPRPAVADDLVPHHDRDGEVPGVHHTCHQPRRRRHLGPARSTPERLRAAKPGRIADHRAGDLRRRPPLWRRHDHPGHLGALRRGGLGPGHARLRALGWCLSRA